MKPFDFVLLAIALLALVDGTTGGAISRGVALAARAVSIGVFT
jgi:hypothetical protein